MRVARYELRVAIYFSFYEKENKQFEIRNSKPVTRQTFKNEHNTTQRMVPNETLHGLGLV